MKVKQKMFENVLSVCKYTWHPTKPCWATKPFIMKLIKLQFQVLYPKSKHVFKPWKDHIKKNKLFLGFPAPALTLFQA